MLVGVIGQVLRIYLLHYWKISKNPLRANSSIV
jgi:hypothetical protein